MAESNNLQEWELLSNDSETNSLSFEEITHSDFFSLDSTSLHPKNEDRSLVNGRELDSFYAPDEMGVGEINKGGSFLADDSKLEVGVEGVAEGDPVDEVGVHEIQKGESFHVDGSKLEVGFGEVARGVSIDVDGVQEFQKRDSSLIKGSKMEMGVERIAKESSMDEVSIQTMPKVNSFLVEGLKMEMGIVGIAKESSMYEVSTQTVAKVNSFLVEGSNSEPGTGQVAKRGSIDDVMIHEIQKDESFLEEVSNVEVGSEGTEVSEIDVGSEVSESYDSSTEMSHSLSHSVGDGEKKVSVWWKLPFDILKFCASRVKLVWSIPVLAAVLGVLIMGRRLYKMKHRSRRIPLKVSLDDKVRNPFGLSSDNNTSYFACYDYNLDDT